MHNEAPWKPKHQEAAIREVGHWIDAEADGAVALNSEELTRYSARSPVCGWRVPFTFDFGARNLDLLILPEFPRKAPRVAVVEVGEDPNLTPHVEEDGVLCLLDDMASVADDDPLGAVQNVLASAYDLLAQYLEGGGDEELRREFVTYWSRGKTTGAAPVHSLLDECSESRSISVWRGRGILLAANNEEEAERWLRHRFPDLDEELIFDSGVLLHLNQALVPSQFPRNGQQVLSLCDSQQDRRLIEQIANTSPPELFIIVGCSVEAGLCLACVSLARPLRSEKGFRPATKWRKFFASGGAPTRRTVRRVDGPWIHGRGRDARFPQLSGARTVVIGCGSVGAPAAMALADAGVGSMTLIDPQDLVSANVGRHPLGIDSIGENKAVALKHKLLTKLPHMRDVTAHGVGWQDALSANPDLFSAADLILSATGIWAEEGALNEWHIASNRKTPVVYGWTEAHAVAGHAVVIKDSGGCLRCGTSAVGVKQLRVSEWPEGSEQLATEPGCGGLFQPYGPVELMGTIGLVAELALDELLDGGSRTSSTRRIWAAREARTRELGGSWTDAWMRIVGSDEPGSLTRELPWSATPTCPDC